MKSLTALLAALGVAGCTSVAPPPPVLPQMPAAFKEADPRLVNAVSAEAQPRGEWWKAFADPVLDQLIDTAVQGNISIQLAAARLEKARAMLGNAEASRWPQAGLNGGANHQGGPLINAAGGSGNLWTLSGNASYEVDVFGRLSKEVNAATLDAQSREALLQSARLIVQADVAQAYFGIRLLDAERAVVRHSIDTYRETLRVTERRFSMGSVAELDVARLRVDVASAEAESLALDRRRAEIEHALAVLVGQVASSFSVAEVNNNNWQAALPLIPADIPSAVLARRPDIAAAQRTMVASQARLGIAKAAWFPSVSMTGQHGFASPNVRDLIMIASRAWGVGALLSLPLFDGGRKEAAVKGAAAELESALGTYREQILIAVKEVEDQLSSLRLLTAQAQAQSRALTAASRATALANSRYNSGLASQLELLDTQRNELRNRRQTLQVNLLQYQSTVGLIRALGGGWGVAKTEAQRVTKNDVGEVNEASESGETDERSELNETNDLNNANDSTNLARHSTASAGVKH
jgi:multidrug efflux system outer membrane protein